MTDPNTPEPLRRTPTSRERAMAQLSFEFVLDVAQAEVAGLKALDWLLVMAVNQANIAPLTRDPSARSRYASLDAPARDDERRPVSVRAVAASLRVPYETARRRLSRLQARGVVVMSDGGVLAPESFLGSEAYVRAAVGWYERMMSLYRTLRAERLLEALPPSNYPVETTPPVRGAVRLMSDYLLRISETVLSRSEDLVSTLVLLPLLAEAAHADGGLRPRPLSMAELGRRTHLPAETVRRHAAVLVGAGTCLQGPHGLVLADAALAGPVWSEVARESAQALQRLFAGLAERGVIDAWDRMMAGPVALRGGAA